MRLIFLACLFCTLCTSGLSAQRPPADYRRDLDFFRQKQKEYNQWLRKNKLDGVLRADSVSATAKKVTLYLRPTYKGAKVCDSIQCAWNALEKANQAVNGQTFHQRLLHKWAFMSEVHEAQTEVVVRCHEPAHFLAKINCRQGEFSVDGRNIRAASVTQVGIPASLEGINAGANSAVLRNKNVSAVCADARKYLVGYYKPKGTPILWKAKVDTSYVTYDEFVLEVTHLSNEICPDGYFEYHRIYIKGVQKETDVELSWEFQGKYGSGILFPPRKNDYKDTELRYKSQLEDFQKKLFKKLFDYLRR
jgi:hypothetical protein